jgi:CheY-like chemotaxis protein
MSVRHFSVLDCILDDVFFMLWACVFFVDDFRLGLVVGPQDGFECTRHIRQLEKDMALRRMPIVACTADYLNAQTSGQLVESCVKECDMDDCIVSVRFCGRMLASLHTS